MDSDASVCCGSLLLLSALCGSSLRDKDAVVGDMTATGQHACRLCATFAAAVCARFPSLVDYHLCMLLVNQVVRLPERPGQPGVVGGTQKRGSGAQHAVLDGAHTRESAAALAAAVRHAFPLEVGTAWVRAGTDCYMSVRARLCMSVCA